MGMVHGLAGSGVLIPLVLSTMPSMVQGLFFLLLFGIGSILGMLLFSGLTGLPFRFSAGLISIALGFFIMWQTGFDGGLFLSVI